MMGIFVNRPIEKEKIGDKEAGQDPKEARKKKEKRFWREYRPPVRGYSRTFAAPRSLETLNRKSA